MTWNRRRSPRAPCGLAAGLARPFALAVLLCASGSAGAQSAAPPRATPADAPVAGVLEARPADPQPRVAAEALARVLGAALTRDGDVLVLRLGGRAVTLFAGSGDALVAGGGAAETTLSAPVLRDEEGWWLPLDAGGLLGLIREGEDHVRAPDGRLWRLRVTAPPVAPASPRADVTVAAPGVRALQLYAPGPDGREDALSLWVADLSMAALVVPEARAALDEALARVGSQRALLVVATSLEPGAAVAGPSLHADGRTVVARGDRLEVLSGSAAEVGPDRPWIAIAWLPAGVRLDRPLRVVWHGAEAEVVFRD